MVRMHQHHLGSWAEDKRKVLTMDRLCAPKQGLICTVTLRALLLYNDAGGYVGTEMCGTPRCVNKPID